MLGKPVSTNGPTWRWDVITSMVEHKGEMNRSQTDEWLKRGFSFMRRYENAREYQRYIQLMLDHPDIYRAHELYIDWSSERWLIEAAVIGNVDVPEISQYVGHEEATIVAYEHLFYDIRKRLSSPGYVLNRVMLPAVQRGLHERDYDMMLKSLAYSHGWEFAKEYMGTGVMSEKARRHLQMAYRDNLLRKGYAAANRTEANQYNGPELIGLCLKLHEIEVQKGGGAANDEAMKVFGSLLDTCTTSVLHSEQLCLNEVRAVNMLNVGLPIEEATFVKIEETKKT